MSKTNRKPIGKITDKDFDRLLSHLKIPDNWEDYETKCWECDLAQDNDGYCKIWLGDRMVAAPRMMCVWNNNGFDPLHLDTIHSCDNPGCCSSFHLSFGTHSQNTLDKVLRGGNNGIQILKADDVREIRQLLLENVSQEKIAKKFGVHQQTISKIKTGKSWGHLN